MSKAPATVADLIGEWDTIAEFAADLGCGYEAARQMRLRGSIAPGHWSKVISVSAAKNIDGVSFEWLAEQHASKARASA